MSTQFDCRIIDKAKYISVTSLLDQALHGDPNALKVIHKACTNLLSQESFKRWHSAAIGSYLLSEWVKKVNDLVRHSSAEAIQEIAEIFIALAAMPDFQMSYYYGSELSPNLVVLGEDDGGLCEILMDADPWFDTLFIDRFSRTTEKFAVGHAMIFLDHEDVKRLQIIINKVDNEKCFLARFPDECCRTRERLASLVSYCLSSQNLLLAISESG